MLTGKFIQLHQDGVQSVTLMYLPEVTEELELSVQWLRDEVTLTLTEGQFLDLAKRLTKAVKKVRKHKRKQAKALLASLDEPLTRTLSSEEVARRLGIELP